MELEPAALLYHEKLIDGAILKCLIYISNGQKEGLEGKNSPLLFGILPF